LSFLKEISSLAPIRALTGDNEKGNNNFSVVCSKLFTGTLLGEHDENGRIVQNGQLLFDFRTELGIGHEALTNKQYIPVIINEVIVCAFYSILRLCDELKEKEVWIQDDHRPVFTWKKLFRTAGVVLPVFSLRSESGWGVGDFGDLEKLTDWAVETGQRVIQILPINDTSLTGTWQDSYPYNAVSVYAFHPMYADMRQLPPLDAKTNGLFEEERKKLNDLQQVDYEAVLKLKRKRLELAFEQDGSRVLAGAEFKVYRAATSDDEATEIIICDGVQQAVTQVYVNDAPLVLVTDENGYAVSPELSCDTYFLVETKAPEGYELPEEAFKVVVRSSELTTVSRVEIGNEPGNLLPETGGMGTKLFLVLGSFLMVGAAVLLVTKRRMDYRA